MRNITATICLMTAVLVGSAGVSWGADFQKGFAAAQRGDFVTALREWEPLAEQGHASAQHNLGLMYNKGLGVPQDYKAAVKWYRLAAEQGHASAQYNLGLMYNKGLGVPQDYKAAVKWYRLATEQGHANAQFGLGFMYTNGQGVPQDYKAAVKWYRLATEQGHASAQGNLGKMYAKGQGVPQDNIYAHMWWNIAASTGLKTAIKNRDIVAKRMTPSQLKKAQDLARECVRKKYKGCLNQDTEAFLGHGILTETKQIRKAAEQGDPKAQYMLGNLYATGQGSVLRDYAEAASWYRKSAEQGSPEAQTRLGLMYLKGLGFQQDKLEGEKWLRKASAQGYPPASRALISMSIGMEPHTEW